MFLDICIYKCGVCVCILSQALILHSCAHTKTVFAFVFKVVGWKAAANKRRKNKSLSFYFEMACIIYAKCIKHKIDIATE